MPNQAFTPTFSSDPGLLIVGDYLFSPRAGTLSGPSGTHHLCARMASLLNCLVEHVGEVVDREHLHGELWPDRADGDAALNQQVARLRHFLGDSARASNYIETVPQRGYRLVVPVYGSVKRTATGHGVVSAIWDATRPADASRNFRQPVDNRLARLVLEFRNRKVCRSLLIYTLVVWLVFQVAGVIIPALGIPTWVNSLVVVLGLLGFPVAAVLSWIFDLTSSGVMREPARTRSPAVAPPRGRKDLVVDAALVMVALCLSGILVLNTGMG